jgi:hypothetical protein
MGESVHVEIGEVRQGALRPPRRQELNALFFVAKKTNKWATSDKEIITIYLPPFYFHSLSTSDDNVFFH